MPQGLVKAPSTTPSKKRKQKSKKKSQGLGDTIEKITEASGIKTLVEAVVGEDCGCKKRKEWLNNRFPYAKDMCEKDKKDWEEILKPAMSRNKLLAGESRLVVDMYERVFSKRKKVTRCGSCMLDYMKQIEKAYEASCDE